MYNVPVMLLYNDTFIADVMSPLKGLRNYYANNFIETYLIQFSYTELFKSTVSVIKALSTFLSTSSCSLTIY